MAGYIKIDRDIMNHWVWKHDKYAKWWLELLMMAQWEDSKQMVNGSLVDVKRGELMASRHYLSQRWMVGEQVVRTFLDKLEADKMIIRDATNGITKEATKKPTKIIICNYDKYQDYQPRANQENNQEDNQNKRNKEINNNSLSLTHAQEAQILERFWNEQMPIHKQLKSIDPPHSDIIKRTAAIIAEFGLERAKEAILKVRDNKWLAENATFYWLAERDKFTKIINDYYKVYKHGNNTQRSNDRAIFDEIPDGSPGAEFRTY